MIESLQNFTAGLPAAFQWLGVILISAIPFVESYLGSAIGIVAGIPAPVAVLAAILGNVASMLLIVTLAHRVRGRVARPAEASPRKQKLKAAFDKYGVAGVSLLGQTILPSQITSAAMVSFGASKPAVVFWQTISIVLWGVAFGVLATLGVNLLG